MPSHKQSMIVLLTILVATVGSSFDLRDRNENRLISQKAATEQQDDLINYPLTDFDSPESGDPAQRKIQRARSRRYDIRDQNSKTEDRKIFVLKETDPPILMQLIPSHAPEEPAFTDHSERCNCDRSSDNAQAHLSSDKTNVYSEFVVRVNDVLKNDRFGLLGLGGSITTTRPGGRVRFPSGKTLLRASYGKNMPHLEGTYLFFLKYNEEGQDYSIITAYELLDGRVLPLDGSPKDSVRPYENASEASFISELKTAIERGRNL